jgi:uncharacterized protein (TIGR01655 family)
MKKLITIMIILLAVAGLIILGKQYYDNRYVGKDYYTMVPLDYSTTPETLYSDNDEVIGQGKYYELTAYDDRGEAKSVEWTVNLDDSSLPQPGTFLKVSASQQIVLGWSVISEDKVPAAALSKIKPTDTKNKSE